MSPSSLSCWTKMENPFSIILKRLNRSYDHGRTAFRSRRQLFGILKALNHQRWAQSIILLGLTTSVLLCSSCKLMLYKLVCDWLFKIEVMGSEWANGNVVSTKRFTISKQFIDIKKASLNQITLWWHLLTFDSSIGLCYCL